MAGFRQTVRGCAVALAIALLCGCSGWESMDYHDTNEIPQGSGLISGDKGGWTIFRVQERKPRKQDAETDEKAD